MLLFYFFYLLGLYKLQVDGPTMAKTNKSASGCESRKSWTCRRPLPQWIYNVTRPLFVFVAFWCGQAERDSQYVASEIVAMTHILDHWQRGTSQWLDLKTN